MTGLGTSYYTIQNIPAKAIPVFTCRVVTLLRYNERVVLNDLSFPNRVWTISHKIQVSFLRSFYSMNVAFTFEEVQTLKTIVYIAENRKRLHNMHDAAEKRQSSVLGLPTVLYVLNSFDSETVRRVD